MPHLHFDCSSGIAGDMTLGALVDAGGDFDGLAQALETLPVTGWRMERGEVKRAGIAGTQIRVILEGEQKAHRHLPEIERFIAESGLAPLAKERATKAFRLLAEAEARVHRIAPEKVHFHEVGAVDAIVDICGSMHLVGQLGATSFSASAVNVGTGTVKCDHGIMPVPAPATAELLRGAPTFTDDAKGEMATPTGCAILRALVSDFGPMRTLQIGAVGNGAGTKGIAGRANFLRVLLGEREASGLPVESRRLLVITTEIDDMTPELLAPIVERGMAAGAVDVHLEPIQMKKGRAGWRLVALAPLEKRNAVAEMIFRETSTFGLKIHEVEGLCLQRRFREVQTKWGAVKVKVGLWGDEILREVPEFEDCRRLAEESDVSTQAVYLAALKSL